MIYGAINNKGEEYYTDMTRIFEAIHDKQRNYNWLITDAVCYPSNPETARMLDMPYCWLSGDELTELVKKEDFQWIWAALSGFDKAIPLSEVLKYELPTAVDYSGHWHLPLSIQHPLAEIEIFPWDSSGTMIFSREKSIVDDFLSFFPFSKRMEDDLTNE